MKCALVLTAACVLTLSAHMGRPAAQTNSQPAASEAAAKGPLKLSEQEKAAVVAAVVEAQSHQKTPKEFKPAVGASVPKSVYQHNFKPEVVRDTPVLKHYWYAYLDREVVLIDSLQKQVVAVIPLPEKFVSGGPQHHGAAEPAGEPKAKDKPSPTGSVPAYTSPETLK